MTTGTNDKNSRPPQDAKPVIASVPPTLPLTNYTLSTVCPSCNAPTFRHACKVRCPRCDFIWDCSEL